MIDLTVAGYIFKVKHIASDQERALRVISMEKWGQYNREKKRMRMSKAEQNNFLNDLSIAKNFIAHPNFLQITDFTPDENYFTYAMEYYDGNTLLDELIELPVITERLIAEIIKQLIQATRSANAKMLIMNDLKPSNILSKINPPKG